MIRNDGTGKFEAGAILIYLADRSRMRGSPRHRPLGVRSATGEQPHPPLEHPREHSLGGHPGGRKPLHGQTRKLKTSGD